MEFTDSKKREELFCEEWRKKATENGCRYSFLIWSGNIWVGVFFVSVSMERIYCFNLEYFTSI